MYRPKIGIVGWSTGPNSFGATKPYLHHLSLFGDVIILPPTKTTYDFLDLVVLPGGADTLPTRYGMVPGYYNSDPDQYKEAFIDLNLQNYINAGIPIWGTCLGFQQLIVYFGGKMIQNIVGHSHSDVEKYGRGHEVNELTFVPKYEPFRDKMLKIRPRAPKKIKVCSLHHQGIEFDEDKPNYGLPECLDVIAYSEELVEFFRHKELPIAGGQSHVEEDFNMVGNTLIKELLSRSPNRKKYESTVEIIKN